MALVPGAMDRYVVAFSCAWEGDKPLACTIHIHSAAIRVFNGQRYWFWPCNCQAVHCWALFAVTLAESGSAAANWLQDRTLAWCKSWYLFDGHDVLRDGLCLPSLLKRRAVGFMCLNAPHHTLILPRWKWGLRRERHWRIYRKTLTWRSASAAAWMQRRRCERSKSFCLAFHRQRDRLFFIKKNDLFFLKICLFSRP